LLILVWEGSNAPYRLVQFLERESVVVEENYKRKHRNGPASNAGFFKKEVGPW
jgi:hypothetical protein